MVNDRQFFITKEENNSFPNWKRVNLKSGYYICYHPDLNVYCSPSGRSVILGYVWQTDPDRKSPQEELQAIDSKPEISHEDIYAIEDTWCGRYILIVDEWLYMDATGMLSIYYSDKFVSSSLNVQCTVEGREFVECPMVHRQAPDFFPGVLSPYEGVRRLMPSQILQYTTSNAQLRPLLWGSAPEAKNDEERVANLAHYFVHSVQNLAKVFADRKIWFALSGGRDSRATLGLFEKAKINFSTFTLWHIYITIGDRVIPAKLSKLLNREHRFVKRHKKDFSQARYDEYKVHTAGMAVDADWLFYAHNQYQSLIEDGKPIVLIRGGIWETPQEYYSATRGKIANDLRTLFPGIMKNDAMYRSTMEWFDMVQNDTLNKDINYATREAWEMLQGSWLSAVEQSFDLMDGIVSIQPLNCRKFIQILLSFDRESRRSKRHEELIANICCPAFANVPYDYQYQRTFTENVRHTLRKAVNKIREIL